MVKQHSGIEAKAPRRCAACGGELRFSNREYRGRGQSVSVFRCAVCGTLVRDVARAAPAPEPSRGGRSRRRTGFDEGAPANPVLDPETAARLKRSNQAETSP
jgi:hypothetical protein